MEFLIWKEICGGEREIATEESDDEIEGGEREREIEIEYLNHFNYRIFPPKKNPKQSWVAQLVNNKRLIFVLDTPLNS
jgi:hypothetical protein